MNKPCRYCAEETKPGAKVCPHCRNWLSFYSLRNPSVSISIFSVFMLLVFGWFMFSVMQLMNPGRSYAPHLNCISVVESRMNFHPDEGGQANYVVTVLTNHCDIAWKNPQLDFRFYNQAGTLIDAGSYTGGGVIRAHDELAVRFKFRPNHPVSEYDSCKVIVRWAYDPSSRF